MKNATKIIICGIILSLSLLCLFGCARKETTLQSPSDVSVDGLVIKWDAVQDATGYALYIDGKDYTAQENYFDLSKIFPYGGTYEIEIKSIGDGDKCIDSDWSAFTINLAQRSDFDENGFFYELCDNNSYKVCRLSDDISDCDNIRGKVTIPAYYCGLPVKYIDQNFFALRRGLNATPNTVTTSIVLPETLVQIESGTFSNCVSITEIVIPSQITVLEDATFYGCVQLKKITLPQNLTKIGNGCFKNCALEEVVLPEGLEEIGISAFENRVVTSSTPSIYRAEQNFTEITIPKSVKSIGQWAFKNCKKLETINLNSDNLESFGKEVFIGTKWLDNQKNGFVTIDGLLYSYKGELSGEVNLEDALYQYNGSNGKIEFAKPINKIASCAFIKQKLTKITIPTGVKIIGSNVFASCSLLEEVILPSDLETIPTSTFAGCTNLKRINFPSNLKTIERLAFTNCDSLEEVTLPDSVTSIEGAFYKCEGLLTVTLPKNITKIESGAFGLCSNLGTVIIPKSVRYVDKSAFGNCSSFNTIFYEGSEAEWNTIESTDGATVNDAISGANVYYYSETQPDSEVNWWHYVNDTPTLW